MIKEKGGKKKQARNKKNEGLSEEHNQKNWGNNYVGEPKEKKVRGFIFL